MILPPKPTHPKGELKELSKRVAPTTLEVDTFEGKIHVEWEPGTSPQWASLHFLFSV